AEARPSGVELVLNLGEEARIGEGADARRPAFDGRHAYRRIAGEHRLQPAAPFADVAVQTPEARQRHGDAQADFSGSRAIASVGGYRGLARRHLAPGERGTQVVVLAGEALEPGALLGAPELRVGLLGKGKVVEDVPALRRGQIAARRELLER